MQKVDLDQMISPFLKNIRNLNFTPREIEVANLIRDGKSTKEIAEIIGIAPSAVHSHRDNIRKKLGLNNRNVNLRSYLQTLK
jgi:DNA-binding CsgD family transcriptional regulator